jgi:hypothetical protein
MTLVTRLLPEAAVFAQLRDQWTGSGTAPLQREPPVILLRTIPEDPIGATHLIGLDATLDAHSELIDQAWADAQLAADTTWLGLGVGVRVALIPLSRQFRVVLVEIKGRRQIPLGGTMVSPLLALRRARRRLVSGVVRGGAVERGSAGRPSLVLVRGGNGTSR